MKTLLPQSPFSRTAALATMLLFVGITDSSSQTTALRVTNSRILPDGYWQFELNAPDTNPYALLISFDLRKWEYWTSVSGSVNYVMQSPIPIADIGKQAFVRAGPVGLAINNFPLEFINSWNGPLSNGVPTITWPQQVQYWRAYLEVVNSIDVPSDSEVFFSGPPGSGVDHWPSEFWEGDKYSGKYKTFFNSLSPAPRAERGQSTMARPI